MHELGHAIFDQADGGKVDLTQSLSKAEPDGESVSELRAQAFAKHVLLPYKLIISVCSQYSISLSELTTYDLARLVEKTHVGKHTLIEALRDYNLIDDEQVRCYQDYNIASELRQLTDHALSLKEYLQKFGEEKAREWLNKRTTQHGKRRLILPVPYVRAVLDAVTQFSISIGKAAELLMIDTYTFEQRFPEYVEAVMD
jgi:Zn-dependent peptidase ImmA (M78 family)